MRLLIIMALLPAPPAAVGEDDVLSRILDNWRARQEAVNTLYCRVESKRLIPKGLYTDSGFKSDEGPVPAEDEWIDQSYRLWIDFNQSRCRMEQDGFVFKDEARRHVPFYRAHLYDGEHAQNYQPADKNYEPDLAQVELSDRDQDGQFLGLFFEPDLRPIFWGQGMLSGPLGGVRPSHFRRPLPRETFEIVSQSGSLVTLRTASYGKRQDHYIDLEVDLDRDCAIIRRSAYGPERLEGEAVIELSETEEGWMPGSWRYTMFSGNGGILLAMEDRIVEWEFNADLSNVVFHMEPTSGMYHWTEAEDKTYRRLSDGRDVPASSREAQNESPRPWTYLIVINVIVLTILAVIGVRKLTGQNKNPA